MNALDGVEKLDRDVLTGLQGFFEHVPELLDVGAPFLGEVVGEDANEEFLVGTDPVDRSLVEGFWLEDGILRILLIT